MEQELRRTGIDIIGDVLWATHFCQFYQTSQDLLDVLVPYFKAGLESNEFCMWVTADPLTAEDAERALRKAVPGFDQYLERGQIDIRPHDAWYVIDGVFDLQRVLDGWVTKLNEGQARGFTGLRVTGNTAWLEKSAWKSFADYEAAINGVIGAYKMIALCTYCLDKCGPFEIIDVIGQHQYALVKREGDWMLFESSDRKRVEEALQEALNQSQQRQKEVSALLQASRAILTYGELKDVAHEIFSAGKNLIGATAGYVALLSEDGTENEVLFLDAGALPCTVDPSLPMPIRGLRGEVYRTGRAAYSNNFSGSEWVRFMPPGHARLENVLFAPLTVEGKTVGLLGIANKPGGFTQDDARLATAFGELAAIALRNDRAYELLENSEERFRSVVETATDAIVTCDRRGNVVSWNKAAETVLGYAAGEVLGKSLTRIMPDEFRERHQRAMERAAQTGKPAAIGRTFEGLAVRKDGTQVSVEVSIGVWNTMESCWEWSKATVT